MVEVVDVTEKGSPVGIILGVVIGVLGLFLALQVGLWYYAQLNAPEKPKKKIGVKKMKKEKMRMGMQPVGE